jgi:tRNA(Ile)-lysidine synthase
MKPVDVRSDQYIWRPFLDLSREQIEDWVNQLSIPYVNDPTNLDTHYDRAWCRQDLWKVLQARYPKMQQAISRTSYLMQDAEQILQEVLIQDFSLCGDERQLALNQLLSLSEARRRQLLSFWMKGTHQYRPGFEMVERLLNEVIYAKPDATAALHWNDYYYVRFQGIIYRLDKQVYLAQQDSKIVSSSHISFNLNDNFQLASGKYKIETSQLGLSVDLLGQLLNIENRIGGEKIHLHGRVGTWPLKKAIQEAQIFPWLRHTIQILSLDNVMLGVFTPKGFWLAQSDFCEVGGWQPKLISLE